MGLLDDAIREHLELKRRRGADAEEVTRLEQEALGPPQRGEFAGARAPADPAAEPLPPEGDAAPAAPAEPAPETADHPVVEPEDEAEDGWLEDAPVPPGEPVEREEERLDQPTAEYAPPAQPPGEEASAGDEASEPGSEDVLEETPDFLQETPDHDRLWFEQKPPRDFDLDR
jgi:hypothetical protein